jgi:hypothetical protein
MGPKVVKNTEMSTDKEMTQTTKKSLKYNDSNQQLLIVLSEKISLLTMKIDMIDKELRAIRTTETSNFNTLSKQVKNVNTQTKYLSLRLDDLFSLMDDGDETLEDGDAAEYEDENENNGDCEEEREKFERNDAVFDIEEEKEETSKTSSSNNKQKQNGMIIKFNGIPKTSGQALNPLDFLMALGKNQNQNSNNTKEKDSDDDCDDNYQIRDTTETENSTTDVVTFENEIKSISDLINIGEKYSNLIKEKALDENKKTKKTQVLNQNGFNGYYELDDKKYIMNLETMCKLVPPLKKLNRMIGIKNIKDQIFEMIVYYLQGFENKNKNMLHSVIEGPPGVGKTKLGKILAQVYSALGVIPSSNFKYVRATDLIGDHVGATKHMTQNVIDDADGGVLFIDEAYALGNNDSKDPYGKECMDTLNFNLSENKKKLIVIIAGYPDQLEKCFFSQNIGLQRRFPFRFRIDKYSPSELSDIFKDKIKKSKWKINNEVSDEYLQKFFEKNADQFKNFGGDIENFFKRCQISHSNRLIKEKADVSLRGKLSTIDLENGLNSFKKNKKEDDKTYLHMFV